MPQAPGGIELPAEPPNEAVQLVPDKKHGRALHGADTLLPGRQDVRQESGAGHGDRQQAPQEGGHLI